MHDFEDKYAKYKNKYTVLKKQYAGGKHPHMARPHKTGELRKRLAVADTRQQDSRCFPFAFSKLAEKLGLRLRKQDINKLIKYCSDGAFIDQAKSLADTYHLATTFLLDDEETARHKTLLNDDIKKPVLDRSSILANADGIYKKVAEYFLQSKDPSHRFFIMIQPAHAILVHNITVENNVFYFHYTDQDGTSRKNTMQLAFEKYFVVISKYAIL